MPRLQTPPSSRFPTPWRRLRPRPLKGLALGAGTVLVLLLGACGGGGGSSDAGTTPTTTPASTAVVFTNNPTVSGVAAVGAPLNSARVTIIDGKGAAVGSATTHASDGSYLATLTSKTLNPPLLLQVRGMDAAGNAQVLHSAVPALSAASATMVANITPLSNAVVALSLGADPQPVFAAPATHATAIANAASAAGAAGDFVRTLVKTPLADLKLTKPDLLADAAFTANKGTQDLLLESLRVGLSKSSKGVAQLQLANKLLTSQAAEVVVELPTAQTELLKTTGAAPATAITSTLKATTSPTATLANLGSLDELSAALNRLIAQGASATTIAASALLGSYDVHNSRQKADLVTRLADYASRNRQFGRWMVTGCADDTISGGLCNRVLVAVPISDPTGTVVEIYNDAVSYNKNSTTGSKWNLIGNGKKFDIAIYPVTFLSLAADGSSNGTVSPNPGVGIQAEIQAQNVASPPAQLLSTITLQTPGNFSIPYAYCGLALMCMSDTPGAPSVVPSGGIADTVLQQSAIGWIGSADSLRGAKYIAYYNLTGTAETRAVYLRADVLADQPRARFPVLDEVGTSRPLRAGELLVGVTLNWANWTAANPDMRIISIRTVLADGSSEPLITDIAPPLLPRTTLELAALAPEFVPASYELWLGAQDMAGRRYYTRYTLAQ